MVKQKACRVCKRIYEGDRCPNCGSKESSDGFKGRIEMLNPEKSEIASNIGIKEKGNFAVKI